MTPLSKKLRFSDVVYAIETTPKSLRLWLQRGLVTLHTLPTEGQWTDYSHWDVAILALVRTYVNHGVAVETASKLANLTLTGVFPDILKISNPHKMPAGALAAIWHNSRLRAYQTDSHWHLQYVPLWDLPPEPSPAYLTLDVETILRTAFDRALESANKGGSE